MKILNLTLKKKWFDLIRSGKKIKEYRENKPYWQKRLLTTDGDPKVFDIVRFKNGYGDVPTIDAEFKKITFYNCFDSTGENGEPLKGRYFVIHIGELRGIYDTTRD